ncbi:hypothetical protein WJX74_009657 [Apatococcus lobatus]|uniref:Coenzyme Q-binding protein COQ10 START domain-containing protein n=1 Tax=Apatococcus lobatus TaxID=904363 RepID=A0AAW1SFP9_9CHLO
MPLAVVRSHNLLLDTPLKEGTIGPLEGKAGLGGRRLPFSQVAGLTATDWEGSQDSEARPECLDLPMGFDAKPSSGSGTGTNVDVPVDIAFALWEDRERICDWMPWIKSVKIQQNDTSLSRWTLSQDLFGRTWQFSWLARNLDPVHLKKIHWKSVEGSGSFGSALEVANRGEILFSQPSPASCSVTLTISYEVPDVLGPFANALSPTVEGILRTDMGRFAAYACKVQAAMASSNRQSGGL